MCRLDTALPSFAPMMGYRHHDFPNCDRRLSLEVLNAIKVPGSQVSLFRLSLACPERDVPTFRPTWVFTNTPGRSRWPITIPMWPKADYRQPSISPFRTPFVLPRLGRQSILPASRLRGRCSSGLPFDHATQPYHRFPTPLRTMRPGCRRRSPVSWNKGPQPVTTDAGSQGRPVTAGLSHS